MFKTNSTNFSSGSTFNTHCLEDQDFAIQCSHLLCVSTENMWQWSEKRSWGLSKRHDDLKRGGTYFIQWSQRFQCSCATWTVPYRTGSIKLYMQHKYTTINTNLHIIHSTKQTINLKKIHRQTHINKILMQNQTKFSVYLPPQADCSSNQMLPIIGLNTIHFWKVIYGP